MKQIFAFILISVSIQMVYSAKPWNCSTYCTDQYGFCGTRYSFGGNDCESDMWNCSHCSKTSGSYTYCATISDCDIYDFDWVYIVVGCGSFVFFVILVIIIQTRRRRRLREQQMIQANNLNQQLTTLPTNTTVTYTQPPQQQPVQQQPNNYGNNFNNNNCYQNQNQNQNQFNQPPQANVIYN